MSRGSRIVAIGQEHQPAVAGNIAPHDAEPLELRAENVWIDEDEPLPVRSLTWLFPAVAFLAIASWTAFFAWAQRDEMFAPATPERWIAWVSTWSLPVLLVCTIWLLAMRNSRREAARFGDAAQALSVQSTQLEERLTKVNQELSLAREFIAAQGRDLDALGRLATERLSKSADRLQALIQENSEQLEGISTVSAAALDNMERLRGQLPVIASSAKDVTNNIANAGRTAHGQLQEMVSGFNRLNEFGLASERQVTALREKVSEGVAEFTRHAEQLDEIATNRFAALAERGTAFRAQLDGQEVEALASIRNRAKSLSDELEQARELLESNEAESLTSLRARLGAVRNESGTIARTLHEAANAALAGWREQVVIMEADLRRAMAALEQAEGEGVNTTRSRLDSLVEETQRQEAGIADRSRRFTEELDRRKRETEEQETALFAQFSGRLEALDNEIAARRERHQQDSAALAAHGEAIGERLAELETQITAIAAHGGDAEVKLAAALQSLGSRLAASREALAATDREITTLTDSSVRLLELIQASAQHSSAELPAALATGEQRLESVESRVFALRDAVNEAGESSDKLSAYVLAAGDAVRTAMGELDGLHDRIDERSRLHITGIQELRDSLAAAGRDSERMADRTRTELTTAIELLSTAARDAVSGLEEHGATTVAILAGKLADDSRDAIDKAMHSRAAEITGQLEQASAHAAGVGREAAMQLRDQLAKVNELAGNLERRVAHARQRAEEQVDNDFARRVALITESLNSNAIDIAKALSIEVSDTAWAAYLRGDRGIFTRRAVSLLDNAEAKAVAQLHETDREFSEHVNRYIHDFEAMLRQLLSTRDGHALGVTLLSSDMGKLYVALAQAIERLRN